MAREWIKDYANLVRERNQLAAERAAERREEERLLLVETEPFWQAFRRIVTEDVAAWQVETQNERGFEAYRIDIDASGEQTRLRLRGANLGHSISMERRQIQLVEENYPGTVLLQTIPLVAKDGQIVAQLKDGRHLDAEALAQHVVTQFLDQRERVLGE